jgi:ubiquinone/menaquinone biosynthesis C-methylase UbiE
MHSIPHPDRVVAELKRVTRRGGRLHLIPEDYGMLHFQKRGGLDPRDFWHEAPTRFGEVTETDLFIGRNIFSVLVDQGLKDITMDYIVVDTLRVPRETFAGIITAWRDGYVDPVAEYTKFSREEARAYFDAMIANILDPKAYAVWMVPVMSALKP